jgi:hypothetical protein
MKRAGRIKRIQQRGKPKNKGKKLGIPHIAYSTDTRLAIFKMKESGSYVEISRRGARGSGGGGVGGRREEQGNVSQGGRGGGGEADIEVAAPCHCGRGLLGSLFGFIIGYIFILLLSNLNLVGILFVSFFTSFGYLGSAVENPLDINFKLFSMIFLFSFSLYECLFLFFQEFPGLFLSSLIVGNLLPYFEIFLRFNGLIVLPNQSSCCENEIELSV